MAADKKQRKRSLKSKGRTLNDALIEELAQYVREGAHNTRASVLAKLERNAVNDWIRDAETTGIGPRERLRDALEYTREECLHQMQMDAIEKFRQASQRGDMRSMLVLIKDIPQLEHERELLALEREERKERIEQLKERTEQLREERRRLQLINNTLEFQQKKAAEGETLSDHTREASEIQKIVQEATPKELAQYWIPTAEEDDAEQARLEQEEAEKRKAEAEKEPSFDRPEEADQSDEAD